MHSKHLRRFFAFLSGCYSWFSLILSVSLFEYNASIANNLKMNKEYLQKFGKHLKELRRKRGLKQDDFDCEYISRSMVGLVEIAKTDITVTKLKVIADILGVKVKDLFDFE